MGVYLNPGNAGFATILNGKHVDKTELIAIINQTVNTPDNLTCISRPRRFGKSYAAQMLCAYFDHSCDFHDLFARYDIANTEDYQKHLNQYNVIYLDIAGFISGIRRNNGDIRKASSDIAEAIRRELVEEHPELKTYESVSECIVRYVSLTKRKFVFIIDEWDAIIREAKNDLQTQTAYLNLLREWFKNGNITPKVVAAAYMTCILPIKKDGSQSAISNFTEYSILNPGPFAEYTGFTEKEILEICAEKNLDFNEAKRWYDGYYFLTAGSVYNPYSMMMAVKMRDFTSYWKQTSAAESLIDYINLNQEQLQEDILKLIAGEQIKVNVSRFHNDFETFNSKDDVLTLLVHLGYLTYDKETKRVRIPNEEVRIEFNELLAHPKRTKLAAFIQTSEQLLQYTLSGNEEAVANIIENIRLTNYAPQFYNNEQALRYIIKFAYIVCVDRYLRIEELPTGQGVSDVVFIPNRDTPLPAMIIELKWNQTDDAAISQIKEKHYPAILSGYCGEVVLSSINYDEKSKNHSCKIERITI